MRTIIAGSRGISRETVFNFLDNNYNETITVVICGGARGVDTFGAEWAIANKIPVEYFPADWNGLGKRAGYVRNAEMSEAAEALVAIWDQSSTGTKHMIDIARDKHLNVVVLKV